LCHGDDRWGVLVALVIMDRANFVVDLMSSVQSEHPGLVVQLLLDDAPLPLVTPILNGSPHQPPTDASTTSFTMLQSEVGSVQAVYDPKPANCVHLCAAL